MLPSAKLYRCKSWLKRRSGLCQSDRTARGPQLINITLSARAHSPDVPTAESVTSADSPPNIDSLYCRSREINSPRKDFLTPAD
jgi:hypothetical protein